MEKTVKVIAENRKARHDYQLLESIEAGLVLQGWEVKSLREGAVNLKEAWIREQNGELFLTGCHITPYKFTRREEMVETRERKLLLGKLELRRLLQRSVQQGLTMVPVKLYFKGARVKLVFALAKGKKLHDKREHIKQRDARREIDRELSRRG